jgi:hypothetical protein
VVAAAGVAGAHAAAGGPRPAGVPSMPRPLIVTCWCGPPLALLDDQRADELARAGFNVVGPPCEGGRDPAATRRALDVLARHGLRAWVADHRFESRTVTVAPGWRQLAAAGVGEYRRHPALAGYFVDDEPAASAFPAVGAMVAHLGRLDPQRLAYVNLLPDYALARREPGGYDRYVGDFIATVRPALLSYDYYPFLVDGDRPSFFGNLHAVRSRALAHGIPFMLIVQAMPHGPYRDPTAAELSWQIFHALAFGAGGISYFAYWTPREVEHYDRWRFRHGLIEHGRPTVHYHEAARLNREARALAGALAGHRSVDVADGAGAVARPLPLGPIAAIDGGAVTVGLFAAPDGGTAALLVSRDYRQPVRARLRLGPDVAPPQHCDAAAGRWEPRSVAGDPLVVDLPAGGARLVRWPRAEGAAGLPP